jgi:hypothetical protein
VPFMIDCGTSSQRALECTGPEGRHEIAPAVRPGNAEIYSLPRGPEDRHSDVEYELTTPAGERLQSRALLRKPAK